MTLLIQQIVSLGETLAEHEGKTHWTVSKMVSTKSDFLHRLMKGSDINTRTYVATMERFSEIWPSDVAWPKDIPRPAKARSAA